MRLKDKTAVVTGGGQGIGRGIARMFAQEGARVVIAARTASKLESVHREIEEAGGQVLSVPTDVGKMDDMKRLIEATTERFGGLDVLVNNAGVGHVKPVEDTNMEDYDRLMDTNLKGMYLGCHLAVPFMKKAGKGSIMNVSSVHGVQGGALNTVYAATKGGMIGCTKALAAELAPFYIRVNTISPGAIWLGGPNLSWQEKIRPEFRDEFMERFSDIVPSYHSYLQPLEMVGEPIDIAYCATYLASDESRFVTGQNFVVDGGLTTCLAISPMEGQREKLKARREEAERWIQQHSAP